MLSTILNNLTGLVNIILGAMSGIVVLWPVAVMAGFLLIGIGTGFIKKLVNARRGRRRAK